MLPVTRSEVKMAGLKDTRGYRCQFVSEVSHDLLCGSCELVARDPHITDCCGKEFCKGCIARVRWDGQACPSCKQAQFATFPNKRDHKLIQSLRVFCTMKERGCGWAGQLGDLDAHLDLSSDDCQYIDVECPKKCGSSLPRHRLPSHLTVACPNRDYSCDSCGVAGTYEAVRNRHLPDCPNCPVACPNGCPVGSVERSSLEEHVKACPLREVACELSTSGCAERFLLQYREKHMEDYAGRHLLLLSASSRATASEFERKLEELRREKESAVAELRREKESAVAELRSALEDAVRKREEEVQALRRGNEAALAALREETDRRFNEMHEEVVSLIGRLQLPGTPHREPPRCTPSITVDNFSKLKTSKKSWTSPELYIRNDSYAVSITVWPNGIWAGTGSHVTVQLNSRPGRNDDALAWPAKAFFTLRLVNQHGDHTHISKESRVHEWERPKGQGFIALWPQFVPHAELNWNEDAQSLYLTNDCLVFQLSNET